MATRAVRLGWSSERECRTQRTQQFVVNTAGSPCRIARLPKCRNTIENNEWDRNTIRLACGVLNPDQLSFPFQTQGGTEALSQGRMGPMVAKKTPSSQRRSKLTSSRVLRASRTSSGCFSAPSKGGLASSLAIHLPLPTLLRGSATFLPWSVFPRATVLPRATVPTPGAPRRALAAPRSLLNTVMMVIPRLLPFALAPLLALARRLRPAVGALGAGFAACAGARTVSLLRRLPR